MVSEGERERASFNANLKYSQVALLVYLVIVLPLFYFESVYGFESRAFPEIMATLTIAFMLTLVIINLFVRKKFSSPK